MSSTTSEFVEGQAVEIVGYMPAWNGRRATVVHQTSATLVALTFHDGRGIYYAGVDHLMKVAA